MKFILSLLSVSLLITSFAFAKDIRKPASDCNYGNVQEEIYIVFHDANRHIIHTSMVPEDRVTFGNLGVTNTLAGKLVDKINDVCGNNAVESSDFTANKTLLTVYKKLGVYPNP